MDFDVLPGPSLPELARTALARAAAATVSHAGTVAAQDTSDQVPVRAGPAGSPIILASAGSGLARRLAACRRPVTVSVPACTPFAALRLSGPTWPTAEDHAARITAYTMTVRSVEFAGSSPVRIPVDQYRAAAPDPLWGEAPGVLRHLEHGHAAELVRCIRAHGLPDAGWVVPRGLDRYGLELLVLTTESVAAVRLSFPDGPVASFQDIPASIRTALMCRCQSAPEHHRGPGAGG